MSRSSPIRKMAKNALVLGDPIFNYLSGHVGQPEVAALKTVGESFVVDAKEVKHGCVQVVGMDGLVFDSPTDLVGPAINLSSFYSAPCEKHGITEGVVIPARVHFASPPVFAKRSAAEFGSPNDHRAVEHSALLEILD